MEKYDHQLSWQGTDDDHEGGRKERERDDKREGESVCTYFQSPKAADNNPHLACGTTDL